MAKILPVFKLCDSMFQNMGNKRNGFFFLENRHSTTVVR